MKQFNRKYIPPFEMQGITKRPNQNFRLMKFEWTSNNHIVNNNISVP